MTINSRVTERKLSVKHDDSKYVHLVIVDPVEGVSNINVAPEDFAREINQAGIPGLTVTYEKPVELPTEPGAYHDRSGELWVLDKGGIWRHVYTNGFGGALRPETTKASAPFTRLIPETEADL